MQKAKHKNEERPLRRYWLIFLPLLILLTIFLCFPLRIFIGDMIYTIIMYGTVSVLCVMVALRVHRRYGQLARRLVAVIALCAFFSGWQVFDLTFLRGNVRAYQFGDYNDGINPPDYLGYAVFDNHARLLPLHCNRFVEWYIGSPSLVIAYRVEYKSWCH
ncbi:MAG: hypothetical protein H6670_17545 [Anaerolineaceae bacterium]|nr:hypothetical protein [Anaerolineaceae bacterium]